MAGSDEAPREPGEITRLLVSISEGDRDALNRLFPIVYAELRARAHRQLRHMRPGDTLQPTALVHEAYVKLLGAARPKWHDRRHFFAVASRAMRQISVDYARSQAAQKRGGDTPALTSRRGAPARRRSGARPRAARSGAHGARVLQRASGPRGRAPLLWRAFGRRDCSRDGGVGADDQARVAEGARVSLRRSPTRRPLVAILLPAWPLPRPVPV